MLATGGFLLVIPKITYHITGRKKQSFSEQQIFETRFHLHVGIKMSNVFNLPIIMKMYL